MGCCWRCRRTSANLSTSNFDDESATLSVMVLEICQVSKDKSRYLLLQPFFYMLPARFALVLPRPWRILDLLPAIVTRRLLCSPCGGRCRNQRTPSRQSSKIFSFAVKANSFAHQDLCLGNSLVSYSNLQLSAQP